ncbi:MAG: Fe-S cluster assembly protein SufD [Bacteroidales bacterium]|jgi:Fe-S cluster assembly protein SufD|nr:Fe-S cluster assembly protein SufD [Bacteroidales bacterium]
MTTSINTLPLKERLLSLFFEHLPSIKGQATAGVNRLREEGLAEFERQGFPHSKLENWRFSDIAPLLETDFAFNFSNQSRAFDIDKIFTCDVYDLDTFSVTLLNGWFVYKHAPLTRLENGTVIGSLAKAMEVYPELIDKYLGKAAKPKNSALTALNTAFIQDGLFIYVPEGVVVEKPIQLINIVDSPTPVFLQPRHLTIAERGAKLTLVHCDHSLTHNISMTNTVVEIFAEPGAEVDHYKIQNKGKNSALFTSSYLHLEKESKIHSNIITLNGGFTRNNVDVRLNDELGHADLKGLYLVDHNQHVDNQVFIDHAAPNCFSNQLYKGILDDQARGVFSGRILVERDAQQTLAYQNNKNLLLTDEAKVNTQPHLEIYADDVKCSHGATVGQLDPDAMFYLRSRGIGEHAARQLLMLAFADEVVQKISIEALSQRIGNMVEKRLRGELSICDQCVLHCSDKGPATFNIDMSKI